uniref:Uncharacterized protein n=1 Tax=Onchocerca volvulus TaxID=6282 RepID=A0A8R1TXS2_ONCVO
MVNRETLLAADGGDIKFWEVAKERSGVFGVVTRRGPYITLRFQLRHLFHAPIFCSAQLFQAMTLINLET